MVKKLQTIKQFVRVVWCRDIRMSSGNSPSVFHQKKKEGLLLALPAHLGPLNRVRAHFGASYPIGIRGSFPGGKAAGA
jgi:hypothetical protein